VSDAEVVNTASQAGGRCVPKWIGRGSAEPIQRAKGWERPLGGRSQPLQGDRWRARRTSQFYLQNREVLLTPLCGGAGIRRSPPASSSRFPPCPCQQIREPRGSTLGSRMCGGAGNRTRVRSGLLRPSTCVAALMLLGPRASCGTTRWRPSHCEIFRAPP